MELWIASTNQGKIKEFKRILEPLNLDIKTIADLPSYASPEETGKTFEDNSRIKAKALRSLKPDSWVMAEDSGLSCDGLNGMPGVHSARYAGPNARDIENVHKVIKMIDLRCPTNRKAHFTSCIVVYSPEGQEHVFEGTLKGEISTGMRGTDGFGYDVCFMPPGEDKTLAELGLVVKNKLSHRAIATNAMAEDLKGKIS